MFLIIFKDMNKQNTNINQVHNNPFTTILNESRIEMSVLGIL